MKVYSLPAELPAPKPDYRNYDHDREMRREEEHKQKLKEWLLANGYTGKRTGETVSFGVGDGAAQYMLAEGRQSILIHLPYGDAYQYPDVRFLPKAEIIRRIDGDKKLKSLFAEQSKSRGG